MSENRVIGNGNEIPWRISRIPWFKATTMGGVLVMGQKRDSIGRPLPGRKMQSHRSHRPSADVDLLNSLETIESRNYQDQIWICGGAEIYRQAYPSARLYLTLVKRLVEGDAFFPDFEESFNLDRVIRTNPNFKYAATSEHSLSL